MEEAKPTFYVFHGEDELTRAETLSGLRQRLGPPEVADLNTIWLDGSRLTIGELRQACQAAPFLADRRLVIVTGLLSRLGREEGNADLQNELLDLLSRLPDTSRVVLVEEQTLPPDHPILKLAQTHERGFAHHFGLPPEGQLPGWIIRRARHHGGRIQAPAAAHLARVIGPTMRLLDQEIRKLVTYAGPEVEVGLEEVRRLVPYGQEAVIFDLVDALGRRDGQTAASILRRLVDADEKPLRILAMVIDHYRLLIQVQELSQAGHDLPSICNVLGSHPYRTRKLHAQVPRFTAAQLESAYRHLLATDAQIKTGQLAPHVALDLLVTTLTE